MARNRKASLAQGIWLLWLRLQEIDAAGLLMNSVGTGARGAMGIKFALQKNDARGEGQVIFLECMCSGSSGFRWCPACHLKKQHEKMKRWRRHWSDGKKINQPLFATRSGNPMDKTSSHANRARSQIEGQ